MSLGYKRAKYIGEADSDLGKTNGRKADVLDGDWDEFVIRFDKKSRQFKVRTAKELEKRKTAKLSRSDESK
jgi:hypothetical protein